MIFDDIGLFVKMRKIRNLRKLIVYLKDFVKVCGGFFDSF